MGRGQGWRDGRDGGDTALRALRKYGVDSQFLYKRPKTVFWTVHVAMTQHDNCASRTCGHGFDTKTHGPHRHAIFIG